MFWDPGRVIVRRLHTELLCHCPRNQEIDVQAIEYANPETLDDACTLLREYGSDAAVLSGGQSLLPLLRQRLDSYETLVDINDLPDRDYIRLEDGEVRVGCLSRHADVESSAVLEEHCPVVAGMATKIGDVQVRNQGTFCGAVAHGDPQGDPPVLIDLLDATVVAHSAAGRRTISGGSFYSGPYETALDEDELVTEVRLPALAANEGAGYEKWKEVEGSYPVVTAGAYLSLSDGVVTEARLVTGVIEGTPTRMDDAAAQLVGDRPTDAALTEAARRLGDDANPSDDHEGSPEFKRQIGEKLAKDALETARDRARSS
jgi:carbon-monoxide dehydrogenase medium subunit